jgi:hypothetical protein
MTYSSRATGSIGKRPGRCLRAAARRCISCGRKADGGPGMLEHCEPPLSAPSLSLATLLPLLGVSKLTRRS